MKIDFLAFDEEGSGDEESKNPDKAAKADIDNIFKKSKTQGHVEKRG